MAEHLHATLVRKGYEAFERGDMDTLRELFTADCTHHVPGDHPFAGDTKGVESIIEFYGRLFEETGGSMRNQLLDVYVDGRGHAVAMHRITADRKGKHYDARGCIVFRIMGDKATDLEECVDDLDKANEFWS
ncbi:nuclear transport factor 2 family protein [Streptomyces sp. NPDC014802]|uniref:nuclear transport factor 2 family protein n=1 Tax=unclassified Streptomyces TaxID=2593676 RepID=UPI0036FE50A7